MASKQKCPPPMSNHGKSMPSKGAKPSAWNGPSPARQGVQDKLISSIMSQSAFPRKQGK